MNDTLTRAKTLFTALPTYLTALAAGVSAVINALPVDDPIVPVLVTVAAWIAAAIGIVRAVTPVVAFERGLLPPAAGAPVTVAEAREIGPAVTELIHKARSFPPAS